MNERGVVAVPFRVALGFLLLLCLWSFLGEQFSGLDSNPNEYDYELLEKKRHNMTKVKASRGSFMPWRRHVRDRLQHLDPEPLLGKRVVLHDLRDRSDLNGAVGRVVSFDTYSAHYTVRLSHHRHGILVPDTTGGGGGGGGGGGAKAGKGKGKGHEHGKAGPKVVTLRNLQPRGRKTYKIRPENVRLYTRLARPPGPSPPSHDATAAGSATGSATGTPMAPTTGGRNYTRDTAVAAAETAAATADGNGRKRGPLHGLSIEPIVGGVALLAVLVYAATRIWHVYREVSGPSGDAAAAAAAEALMGGGATGDDVGAVAVSV